jgi:hypothetical protein
MFVNGWTLLLIVVMLVLFSWAIYVVSKILQLGHKTTNYLKDLFDDEYMTVQKVGKFISVFYLDASGRRGRLGLAEFIRYIESSEVWNSDKPKIWLATAGINETKCYGIGCSEKIHEWYIDHYNNCDDVYVRDTHGHGIRIPKSGPDLEYRILDVIANYENWHHLRLRDFALQTIHVCEKTKEQGINSIILAQLREEAEEILKPRKEYYDIKVDVPEGSETGSPISQTGDG